MEAITSNMEYPSVLDLLKSPEVAAMLRLSKAQFHHVKRNNPDFPRASYAIGPQSPRWHRRDIEEWIEKGRRDRATAA